MEKLAIARFQYVLACDFPELKIQTAQPMPTTMDPTTLVTFLFKAPPEARTVELLGSWDNFQQAYCMHHDRRRGTGFWSGCFEFQNIIYDGDSPCWNNKARTGGLKQGGTYWYYYRLDDDHEACDDSKESTTSCPLLPGQRVNVLEVPMELVELPSRRRSASMDIAGTLASLPSTHTLNPGDKFARLDPPPVSKVHGRCVSDLALNGRLESTAPPMSSAGTSRSAPLQLNAEQSAPSPHDYSEFSYADGGSSIYSRQSWSSAPSWAHSSVVDAFGVESQTSDGDAPIPFAHPEVEWPISGSVDDVASEESNLLAYDFEAIAASHHDEQTLEQEEHHDLDFDFRFGRDESCAEPLVEEGSPTSRPGRVLEALLPSSSCGPTSIRDIQTYGSQPTTSHSILQQRPRLYSLPCTDLRGHVIANSTPTSLTPHQPPAHEDPVERDNYIIETTVSVARSSTIDDAADLWSPTSSAATVSSGGLNTPYRLSATYSHTAGAHGSPSTGDGHSMESVAERLRRLHTDEAYGFPTPIWETEEPPAVFTGYALPESEATRSLQSLDKLSGAHTSIARDLQLPGLGVMPSSKEGSFADSIFSELGYLNERMI